MKSLQSLIASLVLAAFLAPAAHGFNTKFLDDAPISRFNDEDIEIMLRTIDDALNDGGDGVEVNWTNEKTGHHGSITPLNNTVVDGRSCRYAVIRTFADHLAGSGKFQLCRDGSGKWQVVAQ